MKARASFHRLGIRGGYTGPGGYEEMAPVACAAGLREGRWDGLRRWVLGWVGWASLGVVYLLKVVGLGGLDLVTI